MNTRRGAVPILLVVLVTLVAAGGVGYFAFMNTDAEPAPGERQPNAPTTQTSAFPTSDMSSWIVYSNETPGFTFKYPASTFESVTPVSFGVALGSEPASYDRRYGVEIFGEQGFEMLGDARNFVISISAGTHYSTGVSPRLDPKTCKRVAGDSTPEEVDLEIVAIGQRTYCVVDRAEKFLADIWDTNSSFYNNPNYSAVWSIGQQAPTLDYVLFDPLADDFFTARLINYDFGYLAAKTIVAKEDKDAMTRSLRTILAERVKLLRDILSTFQVVRSR